MTRRVLFILPVIATFLLPVVLHARAPAKAELVAALKDVFAYCDKAYEGLTDASAAELVGHGPSPKLGLLTVANTHSVEHYGNLIVYLRMKGLVPPSSDAGFVQEMRKR